MRCPLPMAWPGVLAAAMAATAAAQGPRVEVVIAPDAPRLERFAAAELTGLLERLFGAQVEMTAAIPQQAEHVVVVGSPESNPELEGLAASDWPELSDQGHLVRSVRLQGREALVVGGGSPVATLWAVYELGHQWGVRYLLTGDVDPVSVGPLDFSGWDIVLEPALRLRTWRTINDFAIGPESWGLDDQKRILGQLAKLKFNRVLLSMYPWQPFVHYEFEGLAKQTARLWYGYRYPVGGDTAGRAAFRGAGEFENPDFAGKTSYDEMHAAGVALARGIIDSAHNLGMSAAILFSVLEFPREFAPALADARVSPQPEGLTIGPGPRQAPFDRALVALATTQIRAYVETYPEVDALYLSLPEFPDWVEPAAEAWKRLDERTGVGDAAQLEALAERARERPLVASGERGAAALKGNVTALAFLKALLDDSDVVERPDGRRLETVVADADPALFPILHKILPAGAGAMHFVDYTANRVAANASLLDALAPSEGNSLILTLADDNVGLLPQLATGSLHTLVGKMRDAGFGGFSTRYWIAGDLDPAVYYLSRASFEPSLTVAAAYDSLITPICGDGVSQRVSRAFDMIEAATNVIDRNDLGFAFPMPNVVMKHYAAAAAPPAWWNDVRELYTQAMNEMYRGITRARGGARTMLLYHAKRLEFAIEYMNSVEAVRLAGVDKAAGDAREQLAHLEAAQESMYNALVALSEVARDQSDRGVIAVLNEYGYRPLAAEAESVAASGGE